MKRWIPIAALVPFAALVGVSFWLLTRPEPGPMTFASPERPAPDIDTELIDGGTINFARLGEPMLVNFWAPWCAPCRIEHPFLLQLEEQGVPILGVLHMDTRDKSDPLSAIERGKAMLVQQGDPFQKVPVDPTGDISLGFGISGVPETFLVNADGMIVKTLRGPISNDHQARDFADAWKAEAAKLPAPAAS